MEFKTWQPKTCQVEALEGNVSDISRAADTLEGAWMKKHEKPTTKIYHLR